MAVAVALAVFVAVMGVDVPCLGHESGCMCGRGRATVCHGRVGLGVGVVLNVSF